MQVYRVKLLEGHTVEPHQIVNGYLGNVFDSGKPELYTRGAAFQKAKTFGGKAERFGKQYITSEVSGIYLDIDNINPAIQRQLRGRELYENNLEPFSLFDGSVFEAILCENEEFEESNTFKFSKEVIEELEVLDKICGLYDLIQTSLNYT